MAKSLWYVGAVLVVLVLWLYITKSRMIRRLVDQEYDAGVIILDPNSAPEDLTVNHTFELRNPFDNDIILGTPRLSCGCAKFSIDKQRIPPGTTASPKLTVGLPYRRANKTESVLLPVVSEAGAEISVQYFVSADVFPAITFSNGQHAITVHQNDRPKYIPLTLFAYTRGHPSQELEFTFDQQWDFVSVAECTVTPLGDRLFRSQRTITIDVQSLQQRKRGFSGAVIGSLGELSATLSFRYVANEAELIHLPKVYLTRKYSSQVVLLPDGISASLLTTLQYNNKLLVVKEGKLDNSMRSLVVSVLPDVESMFSTEIVLRDPENGGEVFCVPVNYWYEGI